MFTAFHFDEKECYHNPSPPPNDRDDLSKPEEIQEDLHKALNDMFENSRKPVFFQRQWGERKKNFNITNVPTCKTKVCR